MLLITNSCVRIPRMQSTPSQVSALTCVKSRQAFRDPSFGALLLAKELVLLAQHGDDLIVLRQQSRQD